MPEILVVLAEYQPNSNDFPLRIDPEGIDRRAAHAGGSRRHVTCLLLCLLKDRDAVKILVMNKRSRNIRKHPDETFPALCLDVPGGHYILTPEIAREGILSESAAREEALRELNSEVQGPSAFSENSLTHLCNLMYESKNNTELRAVYAVVLPGGLPQYAAQDDIQLPDGSYEYVSLPVSAFSWAELQNMAAKAAPDFLLHDGILQLIRTDTLPKIVREKTGIDLTAPAHKKEAFI